jgi:outer membrane protein OmpA-like peptidoglycan-associated protein
MKFRSKQILVVCALLYGTPVVWAGDDASLPVLPDTPGANFDPAQVDTVPGEKTRGFGKASAAKRLPPAPQTKDEISKAIRNIIDGNKDKTRGFSRGMAPGDNRLRAYINFRFGSATIMPAAYPLLNNWGTSLQAEAKGTPFEITGHTDSVGTDDANLELSEQRASAVKNYLVSNFGIDPSLVQVVPYGKSQPLVSNATESGRALNRRVEFVFK